MGTITKRKTKSGQVKYLATVRITRQGSPTFSQSKTFSKEMLAKEWIKKLESQIQVDPRILLTKKPTGRTLAQYINRYIEEVKEQFNDKYAINMRRIAGYDIGKQTVAQLTRQDFADFALSRRRGDVLNMTDGVSPSTVLHDLTNISAVLTHALMVWNEPIAHVQMELKQAIFGLKKSRIVTKAPERDRLPSADELQLLTNFFYQDWRRGRQTIPMHLIMWLAIYTGRRQSELTSMRLVDFDRANHQWLIRDVKNPDGSKGNHKYAHLEMHALAVIEMLLDDQVRNKMLMLGYDDGLLLPLNAQTVSSYWARACKILQIEDLKFHDLRHEAATRYAEDGYTIPQLQTITLHASWKSLQRYVNLKKRAERLEWHDAFMFAGTQFDKHLLSHQPSDATKTSIQLSLDTDVVAYYQQYGKHWQDEMNRVLKNAAGLL
ncbi:tyrosine-type recombinase/integrase [Moraxella sp. Pampa]|uniref:tyrosine-type recombinase/integrase n=1 Tax=Moraxella sp. Pampa TaxID=3111978 RepID=UPI002B402E3F|nr:tyrosine-type recombinase/integrase [Moraxella sp. Pampa]